MHVMVRIGLYSVAKNARWQQMILPDDGRFWHTSTDSRWPVSDHSDRRRSLDGVLVLV